MTAPATPTPLPAEWTEEYLVALEAQPMTPLDRLADAVTDAGTLTADFERVIDLDALAIVTRLVEEALKVERLSHQRRGFNVTIDMVEAARQYRAWTPGASGGSGEQ